MDGLILRPTRLILKVDFTEQFSKLLPAALDTQDDVVLSRDEYLHTVGICNPTLDSTALLDTFSNWLLAGTGAIIALMVGNIDKILPHLADGYRPALIWLIASFSLGATSKICSLRLQIVRSISKEVQKYNYFPSGCR